MAKLVETLADRVKIAVESSGLTVAEFSKEAKIKQRTLEDVMYGNSKNPEMATLQGISERSGISIDELVFGNRSGRKPLSTIPPEVWSGWRKLNAEGKALCLYVLTENALFFDFLPEQIQLKLLAILRTLHLKTPERS